LFSFACSALPSWTPRALAAASACLVLIEMLLRSFSANAAKR